MKKVNKQDKTIKIYDKIRDDGHINLDYHQRLKEFWKKFTYDDEHKRKKISSKKKSMHKSTEDGPSQRAPSKKKKLIKPAFSRYSVTTCAMCEPGPSARRKYDKARLEILARPSQRALKDLYERRQSIIDANKPISGTKSKDNVEDKTKNDTKEISDRNEDISNEDNQELSDKDENSSLSHAMVVYEDNFIRNSLMQSKAQTSKSTFKMTVSKLFNKITRKGKDDKKRK